MDTTKTTTHIGLCAGYGGIELGLKRVIPNLRSVALCEIEAFACANLVAKMEAGLMEPAPIWTDLKTFPWAEFSGRVDILTGGYPCQPFSAAGKRLGTDDQRHLWPFIASGIRILRPKMCLFENVEGHISLGLREVIGELEQMGYKVSWGIFSASEVGAPHQRKRVFILAYRQCEGLEGWISRVQSESNRCRTPSKLSESSNLLVNSINNVWSDVCGVQHGETKQPISSIASSDVAYSVCNGSGEGWLIRQGSDGAESVSDGKSRSVIELADSTSQRDRKPKQGVSLANQCVSGREESSTDAGRCLQAWPSRPSEKQFWWEPPRVVGAGLAHPNGRRGEEPKHQQANLPSEPSGGNAEAMVNAEQFLLPASREHGAMDEESRIPADREGSESAQADPEPSAARKREGNWADASERSETQPAMGGDADGIARWLGYAELCFSCDNRTDELRLLGNGVVPATAERAFRTLLNELNEK